MAYKLSRHCTCGSKGCYSGALQHGRTQCCYPGEVPSPATSSVVSWHSLGSTCALDVTLGGSQHCYACSCCFHSVERPL